MNLIRTVTATNTISVTATSIEGVTETDTVKETATAEAHHTATNVIPETVTVTATAYIDPLELRKRQQTDIPSLIPTYATACSGEVRYSSACSCMGVTASTITIDASTTTVTTSTTVTASTETDTTTIATDYVTVTVATTTVEITDTTLTATSIVATATNTQTVRLSERFAIKVDGSPNGEFLLKSNVADRAYVGDAGASGPLLFKFNAGVTSTIDSGKALSVITAYNIHGGVSATTLGSDSDPSLGTVFTSIDPNDFSLNLYLSDDNSTVAGLWNCQAAGYGSNLIAVGDGGYSVGDIETVDGISDCHVITLKAVPVPF
ncbi:hypothetical protein TWF696_007794 [Orbilia brochopaga]|uniref:Uncharacterized protein n=1 Tax=Orbilia brochopaga TaxID=3140254 RepID=A0AAV9UPM1_9PEZI